MADNSTSIAESKAMLFKHLKERGWHRPRQKNIAASICIEAAELLEHYQWDDDQGQDSEAVAEELADIIMYCLTFAMVKDIDISEVVAKKIKKQNKKYPVELFNKDRVGYEDYKKIKKAYRENKK